MHFKLTVLFFCLCFLCVVKCANILAIFHYPSQSHHLLGSTLLKALAEKGHNVTMLSPFPMTNTQANYTNLQLVDMIQYREENMKKVVEVQKKSIFKTMEIMIKSVDQTCEKFFENPVTRDLLASGSKFDVVILNWVLSESLTVIGHHFNAPIIGFSPIGASPYVNYLTGNPAPYAWVPNLALSYSDEMTFLERVVNTLVGVAGEISMAVWFIPNQRKLLQKYFPGAPPLEELVENVDLVLSNSHTSLESPRPYVPNIIPIGGFYIKKTEDLPEDIKDVMDSAKEGVVFFSLGSNIQSNSLPPETLNAIMKAFSKIPYKVLWKFEDDQLPGKPDNVLIRKWYPQKAILAHPNTKIFITHGGLGSVAETLYYGVPMIGIPFFGDQQKNIVDAIMKGFALMIQSNDLSEGILLEAIKEITENSTYRDSAQRISTLYKDQPMNPMDTAIYWVEYVIRHKGAKHLKTKATKLSWYQYFLLDVSAFIAVLLSTIVGIFYIIFKRIFNCCFGSRNIVNKEKTS